MNSDHILYKKLSGGKKLPLSIAYKKNAPVIRRVFIRNISNIKLVTLARQIAPETGRWRDNAHLNWAV